MKSDSIRKKKIMNTLVLPHRQQAVAVEWAVVTLVHPLEICLRKSLLNLPSQILLRRLRPRKKEDWEGLGSYIASGINKGLQKIYNAINWDNVGPKITYFVNAFTRTFNSLVDHIDWDLMGRTVGAGINTIVNTLNLLIEGINWKNLGSKIATGINGLFNEVNWNNVGQLFANKINVPFQMLEGAVNTLNWAK